MLVYEVMLLHTIHIVKQKKEDKNVTLNGRAEKAGMEPGRTIAANWDSQFDCLELGGGKVASLAEISAAAGASAAGKG